MSSGGRCIRLILHGYSTDRFWMHMWKKSSPATLSGSTATLNCHCPNTTSSLKCPCSCLSHSFPPACPTHSCLFAELLLILQVSAGSLPHQGRFFWLHKTEVGEHLPMLSQHCEYPKVTFHVIQNCLSTHSSPHCFEPPEGWDHAQHLVHNRQQKGSLNELSEWMNTETLKGNAFLPPEIFKQRLDNRLAEMYREDWRYWTSWWPHEPPKPEGPCG